MGVDGAPIPGVGLPTDRLKLAKPDLGGQILKPEEMFVVSRLAGSTLRVSDLIASAGLPRAQAVAVIARLLQTGIFQNLDGEVSIVDPPRVAAAPQPVAPKAAPVSTGPRAPLDPEALDLSADAQHELLELDARMRSSNPREVLGVGAAATAEDFKNAYFGLAQRFHPDQFFRKRLGSFKPKVDQVFARVSWAFQELSRNPSAGTAPVEAPAPIAAEPDPLETDLPTLDSNDLPDFAADESSEITGRPRDRFRKAMLKQAWGVAQESLDSLAADEPNALDLPKLKAELSRRRGEAEAKTLFEKGNTLGDQKDWPGAFKCYEQAAALDPRNATYVERAGRALLYEGDLKEAKRLVERALELKPDDPTTHITLANVFMKAGMEKNARRELEAALKLDPKNDYAKSQLRRGWWKG